LNKRNEQYWKELATQTAVTSNATNSVQNDRIQELYEENVRLNELVTKLQKKNHDTGLEVMMLDFLFFFFIFMAIIILFIGKLKKKKSINAIF
jgi:hypothetical protein